MTYTDAAGRTFSVTSAIYGSLTLALAVSSHIASVALTLPLIIADTMPSAGVIIVAKKLAIVADVSYITVTD